MVKEKEEEKNRDGVTVKRGVERFKWEMVKEQRKKTVRNTTMRGRVERFKLTVVKKKKEKRL